MRVFGIIAAACLLTGCMTQPPRGDQLRQPDAARLLQFQSPSDGDSTLVVTRDVGMSGSACYCAVFLDGVVIAKLAAGERAAFHIPAGDHVVGAWNTGGGLCGYREGVDRREASARIASGETKRFRITINPNSGPEIFPTTLQ